MCYNFLSLHTHKKFFFQNCSGTNCRYNVPLHLNTCFSYKKAYSLLSQESYFYQNQEINTDSVFNPLTLFKFCHRLTNVLYRKIILKKKKKQKQKNLLDQDPIQHHTLPFLINLVSINLEEFFSLSLSFITLTLLKITCYYYVQCPLE